MKVLGDVKLSSTTFHSLVSELDTDWAPDPWSWCDFVASDERDLPEPALQAPERLLVPLLGGKARPVPILSPLTRATFQEASLRVLMDQDSSLSPGVFAYRVSGPIGIEHYREALERRREVERSLISEFPVCLVTDLARFFPSISTRHLRESLEGSSNWEYLAKVLSEFEVWVGYALPEGYAASRALANFALLPIDKVIPTPFTRWVDDYRIFCASMDEARRIYSIVSHEASRLDFALSLKKTRIVSSSDLCQIAWSSIGDHLSEASSPQDWVMGGREYATAEEGERGLRFGLRMAALQNDGSVIQHLSKHNDLSKFPGTALPRLAWLLAAAPWTSATTEVVRSLIEIEDQFSTWRNLRIAPAIWYAPPDQGEYLTKLSEPMLRNHEISRPIMARLLARHLPHNLPALGGLSESVSWRRAWNLGLEEGGYTPALRRQFGPPPVGTFL